MEASGSLVKPNKDRNVDEASIFTQGPFFFALLHPRNLPEGPSVVEAFSSSLDVFGRNEAVPRTSRNLHFTPSGNTLTYRDRVFLSPPPLERRALFVLSRAKPSEGEAIFVHAFTQVAAVSHAPALKLKQAFSITLLFTRLL